MGASQDLEKIVKDITGVVEGFFNRRQMKKIGDEAARLIRIRTRLGYGVKRAGGVREKLPALEPSTVAARQKAKKSGLLFTNSTAKRSHLTFTGNLLDSIKVKYYTNGAVKVGPSGYDSFGEANEKKANILQAGVGRKKKKFIFMNLSLLQEKQILRFIKNDFDSLIARRFNKK